MVRRLTRSAIKLGVPPADAQDVAQDTVTRVVKIGAAGWDFEADPKAMRYVLRKFENRLKALNELAETREKLRPIDLDTDKTDETPPESDRTIDGALLSQEAASRNLERLRKSLAGFPVTLALLELCAAEGQLDPRQVAERLGLPIKDVYLAEAQLRRHVKRLRADGSDPQLRLVDASAGGDA